MEDSGRPELEYFSKRFDIVLILILLEDSGRQTETQMAQNQRVLILILLEDSGRLESNKPVKVKLARVLILILLEDSGRRK